MAENKKSFVLYCDLIHTIEQLTNEQAGDLFKHILRYVNDQNPEAKSVITKIAFEPIKQQLKRDLQKCPPGLEVLPCVEDQARQRFDNGENGLDIIRNP